MYSKLTDYGFITPGSSARSLLLLIAICLLVELANIHHRLSSEQGHQVHYCIVEIGFDCYAVVLNLNNVMNNCCQLLVINCSNKLLFSIHNAHNLPSKMTIARYATVSHLLSALKLRGRKTVTLRQLRNRLGANTRWDLHLVSLGFEYYQPFLQFLLFVVIDLFKKYGLNHLFNILIKVFLFTNDSQLILRQFLFVEYLFQDKLSLRSCLIAHTLPRLWKILQNLRQIQWLKLVK